MRIGSVEVSLHRTVRIPDGRTPANLPPSLGRATLTRVAQYRAACPETWDENGWFVPLHDREALWISFHADRPSAIIVGAGGVNAVTGLPLGTKLEPGNYLVAPPQPWIDGWKGTDGSVYQFVATPYEKGAGLSVGEQILGEKSESGGIGIAVFDSKELIAPRPRPTEYYHGGLYGGAMRGSGVMRGATLSASPSGQSFSEMGIGRGGKISQKIYPDPHGLEVWKETPAGLLLVYLVNAKAYAEITGVSIPAPAESSTYQGPYFGLGDEAAGDAAGSTAFDKLKSVFPGDTENL